MMSDEEKPGACDNGLYEKRFEKSLLRFGTSLPKNISVDITRRMELTYARNGYKQ